MLALGTFDISGDWVDSYVGDAFGDASFAV